MTPPTPAAEIQTPDHVAWVRANDGSTVIESLCDSHEALRAQRADLLEALDKWGEHLTNCGAVADQGMGPCTCGWLNFEDTTLARTRGGGGASQDLNGATDD